MTIRRRLEAGADPGVHLGQALAGDPSGRQRVRQIILGVPAPAAQRCGVQPFGQQLQEMT
jgi:hypothetical protein